MADAKDLISNPEQSEDLLNVLSNDTDLLNSLSEDEKQMALQILNDMSTTGRSELYDDLWKEDYDEIPVDFDTFISDPRYLGNATENGKIVYPYWRAMYRRLFDPTVKYNECILTGSIGQ